MPPQAPNKRRAGQAVENPTKRTRVSRACDQCRLAREKCDGTQPACSTCSTAKRTCTYTAHVKKRGIQPGYIRALELALAILFQHNPENESLVNDKLAQGGSSSVLLSRDSKESNRLHKRWRKTRFFAEVDKFLSGGEPSRHDHTEPLSPDSADDESDTEAVTNSVVMSSNHLSSMSQPNAVTASVPKDPSVPEASAKQEVQTRHIMPTESWKLLETYFNYIHSWFPVCEKHDVLKLSYSYPPEGLQLTSLTPESGAHAELWSILALASLYGSDKQLASSSSKQYYQITRSLIPDELGSFQSGHIKALLNLAILNIARGLKESAVILVGLAVRIFSISSQLSPVHGPRYKNVNYGCFVLDNILMQKNQFSERFLIGSRFEQLGPIEEDGLDEWQPWASGTSTKFIPRTPLLALSSFNALIKLVEIISVVDRSPHDGLRALELWRAQLPDKLDHVRSLGSTYPLTPPAILLYVTAACAALTSNPSREILLVTIERLHRAIDHVGANCIPPIVQCLFGSLDQACFALNVEQGVRDRVANIRERLEGAFPNAGSHARARQASASAQTPLATVVQMPTPHSAADQNLSIDSNQTLISPFHQTLTHLYASTTPTQFGSSVRETPSVTQLDPGLPDMATDLDSFFDELATLDNSRPLDNQPQFMQNLGFAPDANMADLFSEYIPLQSSAFVLQQDQQPANMEQYGFYDGI